MLEVYAVEVFRTDTTKEPDKVVSLYKTKEAAEGHANSLNSLYSRDEHCVYRARVNPMQVKE